MSDQILIAMITNFIKRVKNAIEDNSLEYYLEKSNAKNWTTFKKLQRKTGLMKDDYLEELEIVILNLNISNYCKGPCFDDKPERGHDEFWFFGIEFLGEELYLKFAIPDSSKPQMICWSFHEPESKLYYKFR